MLKIPYGITDYKKLISEGYYYVDKTMYLEKLEDMGHVLVFNRPDNFGKTLFTSMLNYYYDINSGIEFESLFKNTYVYNNPTRLRNSYYIFKLDFSKLSNVREEVIREFKNIILRGIDDFNNNYNTNIIVDETNSPNDMLSEFLSEFYTLDLGHNLYIIIDEYDSFINAILKENKNKFNNFIVSMDFIKAFYIVIKKYLADVVDRVFITGLSPVNLDSMTSGFNISIDISTDVRFNEMLGLTNDEVKCLIKDIDLDKQEEIFNLMLNNYGGYLFSEEAVERVFNATLVMYFLNKYYTLNEIPDELIDKNITFDYEKLKKLLMMQNKEYYQKITDILLEEDRIIGKLKSKYNLEDNFTRDEIISLLYYFGYLTIDKANIYDNSFIFIIPNKVMNELYFKNNK